MNINSKHFNLQFVWLIMIFLGGLQLSAIAQDPVFNVLGSDAKAVKIADKVMKANGGRKNWDATHYIAWNFFGSRTLVWDKYTGDVRIENLKNDTKILVNINTLKGKVYKNGAELTQPDSLTK